MALIQYEDLENGVKLLIKGTHERTYKPLIKWSYNLIYMSPPRSEIEGKSRNIEEIPNMKQL